MLTRKEETLLEALEPAATQAGIEIVTVEVAGAKKAPTIKVYIDTPSGVGFDQLAAAQKWIGAIMDDIDPFPGAYTLEVSSPGIDRPLRTPEHFTKFAGEDVLITCCGPVSGRSKWTGVLRGFQDGSVIVEAEGESVSIPLEDIKRARVKGKIDFNA